MKREDGCVYCESVEQATPKSPRTEAKYQSQLKELEAEAAAMREALETIRNNPLLWKIPRICGQDKYAGLPPAMRKIDHALFFTAGKELLDRLQKAEVVVEVAKDTCEELWGHGLIAIEALQKALDDLEGVTGDSE